MIVAAVRLRRTATGANSPPSARIRGAPAIGIPQDLMLRPSHCGSARRFRRSALGIAIRDDRCACRDRYELTVIAAVVVGGVAIRGGAGSILGWRLAPGLAGDPQRPYPGASRSALVAGRLRPRHPYRRGSDAPRSASHVCVAGRAGLPCGLAAAQCVAGRWLRLRRAAPPAAASVALLYAVVELPNFATLFNLSQAIAGAARTRSDRAAHGATDHCARNRLVRCEHPCR